MTLWEAEISLGLDHRPDLSFGPAIYKLCDPEQLTTSQSSHLQIIFMQETRNSLKSV